ncbi:fimbrial protein [Serratia rubidaea]|uniref:fimbrial protein n=1 Tax=Serratia rubidaea TaxID=61652 RepID=UPI003FA3490B
MMQQYNVCRRACAYGFFWGGAVLCFFISMVRADTIVNFHGLLLDNACIVDSESVDKFVDLGTINAQSFSSVGDLSDPVEFTLVLSSCPASITQATVTFSGVADGRDNTLLALDSGDDVASGVGVMIAGRDGNKINLGTPSQSYALQSGRDNPLDFSARYQSTAERGDISAGSANATAQFSINYP